MTQFQYYFNLLWGFAIGLLLGAGIWRTHAIMWRNHVGYTRRSKPGNMME